MTAAWNELWRVFARIGIMGFGGPAAQIAVMHQELVDDRRWLTEKQFLNAPSFCMPLPGLEAMQLAAYCGRRLRGVVGGLMAGCLFVVPGVFVMLALAALFAGAGDFRAGRNTAWSARIGVALSALFPSRSNSLCFPCSLEREPACHVKSTTENSCTTPCAA